MAKQTCVLGFASDARLPIPGTWHDTYIGGTPTWPAGLHVTVPPCPRCMTPRQLVLQAYAPHAAHPHRAIYLFGCNSIACSAESAAWWAVRLCEVRRAERVDGEKRFVRGVGEVVQRGGGGIDWDTDSEAGSGTEEDDGVAELELLSLQVELEAAKRDAAVESRAAKVNVKSSRATTKPAKRERRASHQADSCTAVDGAAPTSCASPLSPAFKSFYVVVDHEPEPCQLVPDMDVDQLLRKYEQQEKSIAASGTTEAWAVERDEEDSAARRHYDTFLERIARAPSQILRYNFGGMPLWPKYSSQQVSPKPRCECGADVAFEVQVLGSCLHYLQPEDSVPDHQNEAGMNFASIAIFTCAADCTNVHAVAENCFFKVISQAVCVQQDDW